ncbi:hypothetical protein ACIQOV_41945 [Kitasatospora sp. NPDC091257]|uniref:hypothetical protein n=1 Tax=Kitasatospora sp. NPDC091257 TaxID=3364084 RepID=UPI0037F45E76
MGWFWDSGPRVTEFDAVIDEDGTIWDAFTDDDGVLWLDADESVVVTVTGVIIGNQIRDAWVLEDGTLWIPD